MVDPPADGESEDDIRLSVIAPKPAPTPVGVGAEGGAGEPDVEVPDEAPEIPDAPPAEGEGVDET
jgi:hypothetical protein